MPLMDQKLPLGHKALVYHEGTYKRAIRAIDPEDDCLFHLIDVGALVSKTPDKGHVFLHNPEIYEEEDMFAVRCHLRDAIPLGHSITEWPLDDPATKFMERWHKTVDSVKLRTFTKMERGDSVRRPHGHLSLPVDLIKEESLYEGNLLKGSTRLVTHYLEQDLIKEGLVRLCKVMSGPLSLPEEELENFEGLDLEGSTRDATVDEESDLSGDAASFSATTEEDFETMVMVQRWLSPIPPTEYPVLEGQSGTKIRVTYVDKFGQIYGHDYEERNRLREMNRDINDFYGSGDKRLGDVESHDWKVGDACIALFPTKNGGDDRYYRAKVEAMDQNKVQVKFVDYGNSTVVKFHDIQPAYQHGEVPILASRFVQDGILPKCNDDFMSPDERDQYSEEQLFDINTKLSYGKVGAVMVRQTRKVTRFPIPVQLIYNDPDQCGTEVKLDEYLVSVKRYAIYGELDLKDPKWDLEGGRIAGDFKTPKKPARRTPDGSPLTASALLNLDETLPERSTADGELSPAELPPTDDDLKLCPWKMPSRSFKEGQEMNVKVRTMLSNKHAVVHLDMHGSKAITNALSKLGPKQPPAVIKPGQKVAVQLNKTWSRGANKVKNDVWYRAYIVKKVADHTVVVNFVDDLMTQEA